MCWIKMSGPNALAAMVVLALVGASSASAAEHEEIVLCKTAELVCELSNQYPNPTESHLEASSPKFLSTLGTIECERSLAIVALLNKLAKLVEGHFLALNFTGNCKLASNTCTVTVNTLGGISITPGESKLTAVVHPIELEGRKTDLTIKCGSFITCTYSLSPTETELVAESDAEDHLSLLSETKLAEGKSPICPKVMKWDATYHVANLDAELTPEIGFWIEL